MDILSSTPSPDNGVPDVTLTIKKMAVAPVDFQPAENSNSHQCVLVKSTQCVEMYKAHMTSDDDATSVSLVVAKTLRALPKDRQHGNMAMIEFLCNQSVMAASGFFLEPVVQGSIIVGGIVSTAAVAQFYSNGNINDYISRNPGLQREVLVGQMAVGLAHIHSQGMIHGNFCPENVCITDDGEVRITDIGVDIFLRGIDESGKVPERWRYKSPEELEDGICTAQTDVYSFASTIYAMYIGTAIFPSGSTYALNVIAIIEQGHLGIFGARKPEGMGEGLWEIVKMCWAQDPSLRPSMTYVVNKL